MNKSNDIYSRFRELCDVFKLIQSRDYVFVALSGGLDSVALLDLLHRWQADGGSFHLTACHYNHKLRLEADADQQYVEQLCNQINIPCISGSGDVTGEARRRSISIHAAAREMRYDFLVQAAVSCLPSSGRKRGVIATGHHRDDQAETVLMRLLNGAGTEGLSSIKRVLEPTWLKKYLSQRKVINIIRPILDFNRAELEAYCSFRGLSFLIDRSNLDTKYPRNRIRHKLLPYIRDLFGEAGVNGIIRTAELSDLTSQLLKKHLEDAFHDTLIEIRSDEIVLDYSSFNAYLTILRLSILLSSARLLLNKDHRITFRRIREAECYLTSGRTGVIELGSGIHVQKSGSKIFIYKKHETDWKRQLHPGKSIMVPGFGRLTTLLLSQDKCPLPPPEGVLYCDFEKVGSGPYIVKPATPGDQIIPYSMTGRRKVSDVLREAGIPPHRRSYPVIYANNMIAAVPPFRINEAFKLTSTTEKVLVLRFE